jgi:hypothetical protein
VSAPEKLRLAAISGFSKPAVPVQEVTISEFRFVDWSYRSKASALFRRCCDSRVRKGSDFSGSHGYGFCPFHRTELRLDSPALRRLIDALAASLGPNFVSRRERQRSASLRLERFGVHRHTSVLPPVLRNPPSATGSLRATAPCEPPSGSPLRARRGSPVSSETTAFSEALTSSEVDDLSGGRGSKAPSFFGSSRVFRDSRAWRFRSRNRILRVL